MRNLFEITVSFADLVRALGAAGRPALEPAPALPLIGGAP